MSSKTIAILNLILAAAGVLIGYLQLQVARQQVT
jgi:Flp pilus assembly protein CpaB